MNILHKGNNKNKRWYNIDSRGRKADRVVTQVLNLARQYQIGRVTPEVTFATFDFTEGWFRNKGGRRKK